MRNKTLILNYIFLVCLIILFLNDHFFKFSYTSWFTGKLSDMAGIILLPMLLTYLFPKLKQNSVFAAGLFFAFWKSPFSENFIKVYNIISPISIHRIVDYSDLLVLLLLPIPYLLIKNIDSLDQFSLKGINSYMVLFPAIFVLMSTAPPESYYQPKTGNLYFSGYSVQIKRSKASIISELKSKNINIYEYDWNSTGSNIHNNYKIDSVKIGNEQIKDIGIRLYEIDKNVSVIKLYNATIDKNLDEDKVNTKIKKQYRTLLKEYFLKNEF